MIIEQKRNKNLNVDKMVENKIDIEDMAKNILRDNLTELYGRRKKSVFIGESKADVGSYYIKISLNCHKGARLGCRLDFKVSKENLLAFCSNKKMIRKAFQKAIGKKMEANLKDLLDYKISIEDVKSKENDLDQDGPDLD